MQNLTTKLEELRNKLLVLETDGREKIREQRLRNDMGDDLRENEGAKMTMLDHDILQIRILDLKREIVKIKKEIFKSRISVIASVTKQSHKRSPRQVTLGSR